VPATAGRAVFVHQGADLQRPDHPHALLLRLQGQRRPRGCGCGRRPCGAVVDRHGRGGQLLHRVRPLGDRHDGEDRGMIATLRRRLLGLLLVVWNVGGVALSVAIYNKAFTDYVDVTLEADQVGNQLSENSDVKVRGLIVGRVGEITPRVDGTTLTLNLDPEHAQLVPSDVS